MKKLIQTIVSFSLIIGLVVACIPGFASAETQCDTDFYNTNDIIFWNPCQASSCSASSEALSKDGKISSLAGEDNQEKIMNYLASRGLNIKQAAGITANLKAVSGYSAFYQQADNAWPAGAYGVAGFKDGQRIAVTQALKKDVGSYDKYYLEQYGGAVSEATQYMPQGIVEDTNDAFLVSELNYLYDYISSYVPSTDGSRAADLTTDQSLTIGDGVKLLDYIKTLTNESDVAKAWLYLYSHPDNRKTAITDILTTTTQLVAKGAPNAGGCSVGPGGLSFELAKGFAETYFNEKKDYFINDLKSDFWQQAGQVNQCTALIMYTVNRYVAPLSNTDHGRGTAATVADQLNTYYEIVQQDNIKPFTVFSLSDGAAGHTGLIVGTESDGSIIIVEGNTRAVKNDGTPNFSVEAGLLESAHFGNKYDGDTDDPGIVTIEHWASVDAWLSAMAGGGWQLTNPVFAAPIQPDIILSKVAGQ